VITDAMWCRIEPLMPADPVRGRRWADHRRTLAAIAWKYRTGLPMASSHLQRRGIRAVIPQPSDQIGHRLRRGGRGGRPPGFDRETYKQRNTVERCINRLEQWRGLATRCDKLATAFQDALHLAAILIWARC
jgi:transposase